MPPAHSHAPNPLINPPANGVWIVLSKRLHVIAFYKDGKKLRSITNFSTGGKFDGVMHPTPNGRFTVFLKDEHHVSSKYKDKKTGKPAPMPFFVEFATAVGFHVGNPASPSHGCIHLTREDAKFIFEHSEVKKTNVWVLSH